MSDRSRPRWPNLKGGASAATIISLWAGSLFFLLTLDVSTWPWWTPVAVLVQTFLYTGLFITAHDAMHRTVLPSFPRLNRMIGALAVLFYALFSYRKLHTSHWRHHDHPASEKDPDYHDGERDGTIRWYLHFMREYLSIGQLVGMALAFNILQYGAGIPVENLLVFWVAPALLSTWQLFYFGTVLPHREPEGGYRDHHRASSNDFAPWLSFLTCYHFGYHWEHHERPDLPWWGLPKYRKQVLGKEKGGVSELSGH